MKKKKWKRICSNPDNNPNCKIEIFYSTKSHKIGAEKRNTNCSSCVKMGKKYSQETNKKKGRSGKNNSMYGRSVYDVWLEKYGKKEADQRQKNANIKNSKSSSGKNNPMYEKFGKDNPNFGSKRSEEVRKNMSEAKNGENNPMFGKKGKDNPNFGSKRSKETRKNMRKPRSEEAKKNMRLSTIKRIEKQNGQIMPNSNPKATRIIRAKAKELGITDLRDAETPGGEFQVCGYFVDGRSKEKNIVIEYYEEAHKYKKERDERRKNEIINHLGCKFIVIKE